MIYFSFWFQSNKVPQGRKGTVAGTGSWLVTFLFTLKVGSWREGGIEQLVDLSSVLQLNQREAIDFLNGQRTETSSQEDGEATGGQTQGVQYHW